MRSCTAGSCVKTNNESVVPARRGVVPRRQATCEGLVAARSGDAANAFSDLVAVEDLAPVVAHQTRLAEGDRLVASVRESTGDLVEDHRAENVHVAKQE